MFLDVKDAKRIGERKKEVVERHVINKIDNSFTKFSRLFPDLVSGG